MDLAALAQQPSPAQELTVMGDRLLVLKQTSDTAGRFTVIHQFVEPGGGPPPHTHTREDEVFFVVQGEFEILLGDTTVRARAGDVIDAPRNVRHNFKNVVDAPGSILFLCYPAGVEAFFAEAAALRIPEQLPQLFDAAKKYGMIFDGATPSSTGPLPNPR